jgi:hypothetical protein
VMPREATAGQETGRRIESVVFISAPVEVDLAWT